MTYPKDLITAQALADALNLSVETIWRYTRENKIPYIELGSRQYRYNLNDVIATLSGSAVREKEPGYQAGPVKKYTYQDYLEIPDEPGYYYEILDGELIKEPAPNVPHQRASRQLLWILYQYFKEQDPEGEVFNAPLAVTFNEINVVQPDIIYISGKQRGIIQHTRIDGPPTLVVEILSPSTFRKDRLRKMQTYQRAKIGHYWLVDPDKETLECFSLRDGLYALVASGMEEDVVAHPDFPGLSIALKSLWTGRLV